jgi:hypothetical protein
MKTQKLNRPGSTNKNILVKMIFVSLLFFAAARTQGQDSLKIMLGKKMLYTAATSKGDEIASCNIPAATMRTTFSTVTVYFNLRQKNTVYKNTLQLVYTSADGTEKTVSQPLTKDKSVFVGAAIKKLLNTYKSLKLRLIQSPANPQMSIPTRIRDLLLINTK